MKSRAMKTYNGAQFDGEAEVFVTETDPDGKVHKAQLDPRLDLANKSPTGFNWGYAGSGPAQLALALLADHFKPSPDADNLALEFYQRFKFAVVARLPQRKPWTLTSDQIHEEIKRITCQP